MDLLRSSSVLKLVLGDHKALQIRTLQTLSASLLMLLGCTAIAYMVSQGMASGRWVALWFSVLVAIDAAFFVAIRSRFSERFANPALTTPQIVHAVVQSALSYLLAGQARGIFLLAIMVILSYGMFSLPPRRMWQLTAFTLAVLGGTMLGAAQWAPELYDPRIELVNFMVVLVTMPGLGMVAASVSQLQARLRQRKEALEVALQRIELLATRDELTGLVNRRYMMDMLEQERQRSLRTGRTFSVAIVDLDHFKMINDEHGHPAGDEVLRSFARCATSAVRASDIFGRWGGEEFLVLMPDTPAPLGWPSLERVRLDAEKQHVPVDGKVLSFTLSAGVTEHRGGETVHDTIARADKAVYEAKAQGRNKVVLA